MTTWKSCKESGKTFIVYSKDTDGNYTEEIKLTCSTGPGLGVTTSTFTYSSGTIYVKDTKEYTNAMSATKGLSNSSTYYFASGNPC